ncbi:s-adenosyl-methyltransferase mraw, putative [Ricinus communis]|uniref:S-adenosyl-methyltransferase mraw, putative n=2 Tax=Ricinus communis TaxID=3988 RepID=B9S2X8_RICCO|nr:s-adenosyl-methyltransferase mraw, putative [Ricinus communis]
MMRCLMSLPPLSRASLTITAQRSIATAAATKKKIKKSEEKKRAQFLAVKREKEKRRTRSDKEFEYKENDNHVPVLLGEVIDVFSSLHLRSFVDCTLGAAGHSSAIIKGHPELENYVGMDVDPVAHAKARACIDDLMHSHSCHLKVHTFLSNFKHVKPLLAEVDPNFFNSGVDAILMDLGMSSMQVNNPERGFSVLANGPLDMRMDPQASLKAEDILNSWPDTEVGRVLREYGEESNWHLLQNKIVQARLRGGLHTTGDLVDLIRNMTHGTRGGRQGWIKTATRVFQALRIAVNDELGTLEKTLNACFECLAPGGRLAVISFHSLEDRIVKQTFLKVIETGRGDGDADEEERFGRDSRNSEEMWIKSVVQGRNGRILTKRPVTPSEEEERLNRRSRSAKLRVVEKV